MNLVQEYFVLVNEVVSYRETVYDGATAEVHNRKVKRMSAIATEIEQNFPELKNDFFELLSNDTLRIVAISNIKYDPCIYNFSVGDIFS